LDHGFNLLKLEELCNKDAIKNNELVESRRRKSPSLRHRCCAQGGFTKA